MVQVVPSRLCLAVPEGLSDQSLQQVRESAALAVRWPQVRQEVRSVQGVRQVRLVRMVPVPQVCQRLMN